MGQEGASVSFLDRVVKAEGYAMHPAIYGTYQPLLGSLVGLYHEGLCPAKRSGRSVGSGVNEAPEPF
jgi:hypothetical protein